MIDHLSLPVSDVDATALAYSLALAPLGYSVLRSYTQEQIPSLPYAKTVGLGANSKPDLWLRPARTAIDYNHVALTATHRNQVDAFHAAALGAGMTDDGAPGPRQHYHPNYYGAFVRDADGHSLEVVCHTAPSKPSKKTARAKPKPKPKPKPKRAPKKR
jgi:catechol 2,3-dioxygenase-like lactoylglutathione lyase family enzyme